jgi:hypothetical protein
MKRVRLALQQLRPSAWLALSSLAGNFGLSQALMPLFSPEQLEQTWQ